MSHTKANNGQAMATYEFQFPQPKEKISLCRFMYNDKDGTCLGRTPASWAKILFFYAIFYAVLSGLFAICMQALFSTISKDEPKFQLAESLIGTNPGLGYRPLSEETERGSIIKFDTTKADESVYWIKLLNEFLAPYIDKKLLTNGGKNQKICSFGKKIGADQVCEVPTNSFGPCSPANDYGYKTGKPCIFLKLNKIYGWQPNYYHADNLPKEMPKDLIDHIKKLPAAQQNQIWVSCKGQHAHDEELIGDLEYFPTRGFQEYYYPYKNIPGYLSPLVAVQLKSPAYNQLVSIECRAWADNIIYSGSIRDRKGSVSFQLNIDTGNDTKTSK